LNHFFDGGSTGGATHSPQFKGEIIHDWFPRVTMKFLAKYTLAAIIAIRWAQCRDFILRRKQKGGWVTRDLNPEPMD
jgi:hypothetical protein